MFGGIYAGRRVVLTGHTGFKGSWLALWLRQLGAEVTGLALPTATRPSHWDLLQMDMHEHVADIRDAAAVRAAMLHARPEIVFHLAAQALVRPSYATPLDTWSTNVLGTAHVLDACRDSPNVRAIVVVTSDKCYDNRETGHPYRESDPLGGHDPYSASKAATELVASSYALSFFGDRPSLATARAGNVIGGGDWAADRLVPDLIRGVQTGHAAPIRRPQATRPWQHVLEPLAGYLLLGQRLWEGRASATGAWNFGPADQGMVSVAELLEQMRSYWPRIAWKAAPDDSRREATLLRLDSRKAREELGWAPVWNLRESVAATVRWYAAYVDHGQVVSQAQLQEYVHAAAEHGHEWARR